MTFGLRTIDASGNTILSVQDAALRIIHRQPISSTSSGSVSLPGYNDANAKAFVIPNEIFKATVQRVWMSNNAANWTHYNWLSAGVRNLFITDGELIVVANA